MGYMDVHFQMSIKSWLNGISRLWSRLRSRIVFAFFSENSVRKTAKQHKSPDANRIAMFHSFTIVWHVERGEFLFVPPSKWEYSTYQMMLEPYHTKHTMYLGVPEAWFSSPSRHSDPCIPWSFDDNPLMKYCSPELLIALPSPWYAQFCPKNSENSHVRTHLNASASLLA